MLPLFDMSLRPVRWARAGRLGPELFLHEHAFADCLERLQLLKRRFARALLIGCEDASWTERLGQAADAVEAGDTQGVESLRDLQVRSFDLVMAIGVLDTINELPLALQLVRHAMRADGLFLGALSGGDTLPQLRTAMRAADAVNGAAAPHVHPRIEAAAVAPLLSDAGFIDPVVDVDRVAVSYASLERLVLDLRAMAATNMLSSRPRFIGKAGRTAAIHAFKDAGTDGRTVETFEIMHFAAWTPKER